MDEWVDGCMDGWMDGQMDGWLDGAEGSSVQHQEDLAGKRHLSTVLKGNEQFARWRGAVQR